MGASGRPIPSNDLWIAAATLPDSLSQPSTITFSTSTDCCWHASDKESTMATMTLRGIDEKTAEALKERAQKEGTSVNAVTLRLIRESLGLDKRKRNVIYNDLDHLAGTWSQEEVAEFERNTAVFEKVDEEIWK
jgi:plasmid stability protein